MTRLAALRADPSPAFRRLGALAPLDGAAEAALAWAAERTIQTPARREALKEGVPIAKPLLLLRGWAARVRDLADGRRQVMSFLLPGDLIGHCDHPGALTISSLMAVTPAIFCAAPGAETSPALAQAYAVSRALDEAHLLAQITRLGRMSAEERILDLFLELRERLDLCGLATGDRFALPLTQEMLADVLGLTSVHVNRMIQQLRRQGDVEWRGGEVTLRNVPALAHRVGRRPVRVSG